MSFVDDVAVVFGAVSFAGESAVVVSLGNVAVLAVRAAVLGAVATAFTAAVLGPVIAAFTAAMFAFKLNAGFSRRFFFWECLPCPGPGIVGMRKREKELGEVD